MTCIFSISANEVNNDERISFHADHRRTLSLQLSALLTPCPSPPLPLPLPALLTPCHFHFQPFSHPVLLPPCHSHFLLYSHPATPLPALLPPYHSHFLLYFQLNTPTSCPSCHSCYLPCLPFSHLATPTTCSTSSLPLTSPHSSNSLLLTLTTFQCHHSFPSLFQLSPSNSHNILMSSLFPLTLPTPSFYLLQHSNPTTLSHLSSNSLLLTLTTY